jgi:hypothetical protein
MVGLVKVNSDCEKFDLRRDYRVSSQTYFMVFLLGEI